MGFLLLPKLLVFLLIGPIASGFLLKSIHNNPVTRYARPICSIRSQALDSDPPSQERRSTMISRRILTQYAAIAGVALLYPQYSLADMTLETFKRAYYRYVPRIESGRDLYVLKLRKLIDSQAWADILTMFEKQSQAQEGSAKAQVNLDIKVSELEKELNIPMEVWFTSFAEKGTSPKQRKLEAQAKALRAALEKLRIAAGGNGDSPSKEAAMSAWEEGRAAFNRYIKVANKGLTLQVRKLDQIPEDVTTYAKTPERPPNNFSQIGSATFKEVSVP